MNWQKCGADAANIRAWSSSEGHSDSNLCNNASVPKSLNSSRRFLIRRQIIIIISLSYFNLHVKRYNSCFWHQQILWNGAKPLVQHVACVTRNLRQVDGFPSQLERYKTRHNNILVLLAGWMKAQMITGYEICVDIASPGFSSIDLIFQTSVHPDLIIFNNSSVNVLELTVCHELNLLKSKLNKQNQYKNLKS